MHLRCILYEHPRRGILLAETQFLWPESVDRCVLSVHTDWVCWSKEHLCALYSYKTALIISPKWTWRANGHATFKARGMYLLAQLQSFYQSLAPFPKLWLIYLDLCSCSNSRRLKLPCYPKSDFYFFLAFKIFFDIRIFFFKILHTIS